jgi:hypothetical protein
MSAEIIMGKNKLKMFEGLFGQTAGQIGKIGRRFNHY